jgi:hypothetical protein
LVSIRYIIATPLFYCNKKGQAEEGFCINPGEAIPILQIEKEFHRSYKIRLYVMGKFIEEETQNTTRKFL